MKRIEIMTEGVCYRTLCVEKDVTREELEAFDTYSGTSHRWKLSDDPTFRTGETNPCVCDQDPDRMHYLQCC